MGIWEITHVPKCSAIGYTDHEPLDNVGLIHVNGRVYDPRLGRFLSPNPLMQAPHNTPSYKRYAYVFNNPFSFVDPSGYLCEALPRSDTISSTDSLGSATTSTGVVSEWSQG